MNLFIIKRFGARDYKIFLPLFYLVIALLLFVSMFGLYENDWSLAPNYYSYCSDSRGCFNEYYNSSICKGEIQNNTICTQIRLEYKESIGNKPSRIVANSNLILVASLGLFLFLNTLLFNKELLRGKL